LIRKKQARREGRKGKKDKRDKRGWMYRDTEHIRHRVDQAGHHVNLGKDGRCRAQCTRGLHNEEGETLRLVG
jgi:hypothetical protein